ncbi:MAG TPA: carbohydrate ABC transporter permease [Devosia sp.]|nr:carbohydrate ABC transporter permease [Devosia sp.]
MRRYSWGTGLLEIVMVGTTLVFLVPVYILVNLAFRRMDDLSTPLLPTSQPTIDNFVTAWEQAGLGSALLNSLFITVVSVTLIVIMAALASYPLARVTGGWSRAAYMLFMIGLLLPFQLVFIPLYQTFSSLKILGTPWPLIILYAGHQMPFSIFLYTSFLRALPRDVEEAASIDGANLWQSFWYVVFPILTPVTGTVIILNAILVWNDFMSPLLYLGGSRHQTVPVAIYGFVGEFNTVWPVVFAGLLIGMVPVLLAYFALQERIMQGFNTSARA